MNPQRLDSPDDETYRSGKAILSPEQDERLTNDTYDMPGPGEQGGLGEDDPTDDNLTPNTPEEASVEADR